jgi:transposase-like protein
MTKKKPTIKPRRKRPAVSGETRPEPKGLRPVQVQAIIGLVRGDSYEEVARAAGVGISTLREWRRDPTFAAELDAATHDLLDHAQRKARGLVDKAFRVLGKSLERALDPEAEDVSPTQIAAAREVLSRVVPEKSESTVTHKAPDLAESLAAALAHAPDETVEALAAALSEPTPAAPE